MAAQLEQSIQTLSYPLPEIQLSSNKTPEPAVLHSFGESSDPMRFVCRSDGDRYLLVEFGPNVLDLIVRLRAHAVEQEFRKQNLDGIVDITPGVRSIQIHYNPNIISRDLVLNAILSAQSKVPESSEIVVPSRIVHMPISWNDPQAKLAAEKYMQSVRPDAPWCPDNIEFIRRINGLESQDDVYKIIFDASYFVLGLGDVYLGAPVATPIDPRHRLVTTKYNPARTWTPENAVGIGGAYMCIYGMEGPGGYQLFGRTIQVWNTFKTTREFEPGHPWLLRFFDQIRFYPVDADQLMEMREGFLHGDFELKIEPTEFSSVDYKKFLTDKHDEITASRSRKQQAFNEERERWAAMGLTTPAVSDDDSSSSVQNDNSVPDGCDPITSPLTSNVWKVLVEPGQSVIAGETLLVLEAMKMEVAVTSTGDGIVESVLVKSNELVYPGQNLIIMRPN
jgi:urea carboxylase